MFSSKTNQYLTWVMLKHLAGTYKDTLSIMVVRSSTVILPNILDLATFTLKTIELKWFGLFKNSNASTLARVVP